LSYPTISLSDGLSISLGDGRVRTRGFRAAVLGESGCGKSYLLGKMAEQLMQQGMQVVVLDVHSEHHGLVEHFRDSSALVGGENGDVPLSGEAAGVYSEMLLSGMSLFFDLRDLLLAEGEREYASTMQEVLSQLYASVSRSPRPLFLFVEEAHLLAPQMLTKHTQRVARVLSGIVTGGRKFGVNSVIASQRPALLSKTVLSQCWLRFFGRMTEKIDRDAVRDYFRPGNPDVLKDPLMPPGVFYLWGWVEDVVRVEVSPDRVTKHGGETVLLQPIERSGEAMQSISEFREKVLRAISEAGERVDELARLREEVESLKAALRRKEEEIRELSLKADIAEAIRSGLSQQAVSENVSRLVSMYEQRIRSLQAELDEERRLRREREERLRAYEELRSALAKALGVEVPVTTSPKQEPYLTQMERRILETVRKYLVLPEYRVAELCGTTLKSSSYREARNRLVKLGLIKKTKRGLEPA